MRYIFYFLYFLQFFFFFYSINISFHFFSPTILGRQIWRCLATNCLSSSSSSRVYFIRVRAHHILCTHTCRLHGKIRGPIKHLSRTTPCSLEPYDSTGRFEKKNTYYIGNIIYVCVCVIVIVLIRLEKEKYRFPRRNSPALYYGYIYIYMCVRRLTYGF